MDRPYNILIAGVGGQGNLVAGNVLAEAAMKSGLRPVIGQIFGASRRGGSVFTHVRIWKEDLGPLIPHDHVDLLLGLEPLETLRAAVKLASKRTSVIMSRVPIPTTKALSREHKYPDLGELEESLREICSKLHPFNASESLSIRGMGKALNMYLLGVMVALKETLLEKEHVEKAIETMFPTLTSPGGAFYLGISETRG